MKKRMVVVFLGFTLASGAILENWQFAGEMPKSIKYHVDPANAKASFSVVADVVHLKGKGVFQAAIAQSSSRKNTADIQLMFVTDRAFSGGEKVRVSFCVKGSETTTAIVDMRLNVAPYGVVADPISKTFMIGTDWKEIVFETTMKATEGKPCRAPGFFLGQSAGTIQFADIKFELVSVSGAPQESFFKCNFAADCRQTNLRMKGSFAGALPELCSVDFAHWNRSVVVSSIENNGRRTFLRFRVKELDHAAQFRMESADIAPGYYKLWVESKAPGGFFVEIRQMNPPYASFWSAEYPASSDWSNHIFYLRIDPSVEYVSLGQKFKADAVGLRTFLKFPKGTTEMVSLNLIKAQVSGEVEKHLIAADKAREAAEQAILTRPPADAPNFFRNSRFPLGLPSGWSIQRYSYPGEYSVETDTNDIGPSGCHPLKIDGTILCSEPFNTPFYNTKRKCVLSFFYKAKKDFAVSIKAASIDQRAPKPAERKVTETNMPASDVWRRGELEFTESDEKTKCMIVYFTDGKPTWTDGGYVEPFHSEIKLDSLQVYYGENGRAYQSAGECEIAIAPIASDMSAERVSFSDEPARIKYFASGNVANTVLKSIVYDIYGQQKALADIAISTNPTGEFSYELTPKSRLGQFRVEVWAEKNGKRVSPYNEIVLTRVKRPIYWGKDAPNSPFGIHVLPQKVWSMKAAGMNWARFHDTGAQYIKWAFLEPEKGKWSFRDKEVAWYRAAHLKIAGVLDTVPAWAALAAEKGDLYWDRYRRPRNLDDYANYVRTVVSHYKNSIDEYLIWNEPTWNGLGNDSKYWPKKYEASVSLEDRRSDSIKHFIELSKIAYSAAKEVFPAVRIAGINGGVQPWMEELRKGGAYEHCDMADFHYYPPKGMLSYGYPGDLFEKEKYEAVRMAKEQGKPLINSEGNPAKVDRNVTLADNDSSVDMGTGIYRHSIVWKTSLTPISVANATVTYTMKNLAMGISQVFLYSAQYPFLALEPGLLTMLGADGFPAPSYAAFSSMAWLLEDRKFVKCVLVGEDVWAYVFEGRGESVAAISGKEHGKYSTPDWKELVGLDLFGNPIVKNAKYSGQMMYLVSKLPATVLAKRLEKHE